MKTLKSTILGLVLLVICGAAKANNTKDEASAPNHAINTYVDAMTRGKLDGLNNVLDKTAEFSVLRGKTLISYSKKEMVDYLQSIKDIEQTCTTSTSIVESTDSVTIVKVDMKYSTFVRSNYVTLANTGNGWKITNVYSTFK